jgi:hypothetical protein
MKNFKQIGAEKTLPPMAQSFQTYRKLISTLGIRNEKD